MNRPKAIKWILFTSSSVAVIGIMAWIPQHILSWTTADWNQLSAIEKYQQEAQIRTVFVQMTAALVVVLGGIAALRQASTARDQASRANLTNYVLAFQKAIELLFSKSQGSQCAGISSLASLARSDGDDSGIISDALARFIRSNNPAEISRDTVALALNALQQIRAKDRTLINLKNADLSRSDLRGSDMTWLDLSDANLREADLRDTDFSWSVSVNCDLAGARTTGAKSLSK